MTRPIRVLVCVATLSIAFASPANASRPNLYGVTAPMFRAAARVAHCEEGGNWHYDRGDFAGGLGFRRATWTQFRKPRWPSDMAAAPPHMQANALWRLVWHYGIPMPDQRGCTGGY